MAKARALTEAEILAQLPAARARGEAHARVGLYATSARYDAGRDLVMLEMASGHLVGIPRSALPHIATARPSELSPELDEEGTALRFPRLDVDYSVPGLVLALTAREVGRRGGQVKTVAKGAAARANGANGGRPRKPTRA